MVIKTPLLLFQEYASALMLNGYETVESLMHLQEKHLIELNFKDPEHRRRLLTAAEYRYTEGEKHTEQSVSHKSVSVLQLFVLYDIISGQTPYLVVQMSTGGHLCPSSSS